MTAVASDALKAPACTLVDEEDPSKGHVPGIRIGLSSGQVVSHVVGTLTPRYSIIGSAVNKATELETLSSPGRIQCCQDSADTLKEQDPHADLFLRGSED